MKTTATLSLVLLPTVITGCATMLAHYKMSEQTTTSIATGVVGTQACTSYGLLPESLAENYHTVTAHLLDIAVVDTQHYGQSYDAAHAQFFSMSPAKVRQTCRDIAQQLPAITNNYRNHYQRISRSLNQDRAAESLAISNFANQRNYATDPIRSEPVQNQSIDWEVVPGSLSTQNNGSVRYMMNTSEGIQYRTCQNLNGGNVYCH